MIEDVYYKESTEYIRIRTDTEEEATSLRNVLRKFGFEVDIYSHNNYKRSVYINKIPMKKS